MIFNVRITLKNKNNEIRVFYKEIGAANLSSYDGIKSRPFQVLCKFKKLI